MLPFRCSLRIYAVTVVMLLAANLGNALPTPLTFNGVATVVDVRSFTLGRPSSVVTDKAGDLFIADSNNNRIITITPQGDSSVLSIAGISPMLSHPAALAVDGKGTLYIADEGNARIVMVNPAGTTSVLSIGSIALSSPQGLAIDAKGDIYIADTTNNRIIKVTAGGAASIYSIAGLTTALNMPKGLSVDSSGKLYIADSANDRIVAVSRTGAGVVLNLSALDGLLNSPSGVAVDSWGTVYIADTNNSRIIKSSPDSVVATTDLTIDHPTSIFVDAMGEIYIADSPNGRIVEIQQDAVGYGHLQLGGTTGTMRTLSFTVGAGTSVDYLALNTLGTPNLDFTIGDGTTCASGVYTSSTICTIDIQFLPQAPGLRQGGMILLSTTGGTTNTLTVPLYGFADSPVAALSPGKASLMNTGGELLAKPFQIAIDGAGNMYVSNYSGRNIMKIPAGGGDATLVTAGDYVFGEVTGMVFDGAGDLFIADQENSKIVEITAFGVVSELTVNAGGDPISSPTALAFDQSGNLYIADYGLSRIVRVRPQDVTASSATLSGTVVDSGGYTFTDYTITGLAIDAVGNLYAADRYAGKIIKITPDGNESTLTVTGLGTALNNPQGVAVDGMGNIYIADSGNNRIVEVTTAGLTSVVQLQGLSSPSEIGFPFGSSVDSYGNVYIPDWDNNRVVKIDVSATSLEFADTNQGSTSADSAKTATVTNIGDLPLIFSADPGYTADFTQDPGETNPCTLTTLLAAGTACDISVKFTPHSSGSLTAEIAATNNAFNLAGYTETVSVSGMGIISGDTTSTAVLVGPAPATYGQRVTVAATVNDTATGNASTIPTGSVTFTDQVGSTTIALNGGTAVNLAAGTATLSGVLLSGAGTHTITAKYAGVGGAFLLSSNIITESLNRAGITLHGPSTLPILVGYGKSTSIALSVTGQYSGAGVEAPSGNITYTITNSANTVVSTGSAQIADGEVVIPVASTLPAGLYSVVAIYSGDNNYNAGLAVTIALRVNQAQSTVSWTSPSTITYGTTLGGELNAMAMNGTAAVPGTFSYKAMPGGVVTPSTILPAGSYSLAVTFTPTDAANYTPAEATILFLVNKATSSVVLNSSLSSVLVSNPITLTALIFASASLPTGTATFYDGATPLGGSVAVNNGVAILVASSLPLGIHSLTVVYSGDANTMRSASNQRSEVISDFSLSLSSGSSTGIIVHKGGTATYHLTIAPESLATTIPSMVNLTVSGLPAGANYTITPSSLAAGSEPTTVTLIVTTAGSSVTNAYSPNMRDLSSRFSPITLALLLVPFCKRMRRGARQLRHWSLLLWLALAMVVTGGLSGCGSAFFAQTSQTYTVTVTGTSGQLSHSTDVSLTIK